MKTILLITGLMIFAAGASSVHAQCSAGTTPMSITYDSVVYGNGNASRVFSVPKFDPSLGTLISATVSSTVGLQYSYILENQTPMTRVFKTKIVRTDDISGAALDPESVSAVNQTPYVSSTINSGQSLNYGPANMSYSVANIVDDGRLVNFMGTGTVDFDYETGTSASVQGPLPWQLSFTSVMDTTSFSVVYQYCTTTLLSSGMLFYVMPKQDKIVLNWRQLNTVPGRAYEVQVSKDGQSFSTLSRVEERSDNNYSYVWMGNTPGKMYFRIAELQASGDRKYSYTREASLQSPTVTGIRLYPSFYTGGAVQLSFPYKADWQINIYGVDGRLVLHSSEVGTSSAQLPLPSTIANGVYTAEVVNPANQLHEVTRIVVQR